MANRFSIEETNEGPSFGHFSLSVIELLSIIKNWFLAKLFLKTSKKRPGSAFVRPKSGGAFHVEGKMKDELGLAKYRKGVENSSASHRRQ